MTLKFKSIFFMLTLLLLAMEAEAHVYWNPNAATNGNGTEASPYRDWTSARNALASQGNDQWIILMSGWTLNSNLTLDGTISGKANARVIRYKTFTGNFFHTSSFTLTLSNITLSGKTINSSGVIVQNEVTGYLVGSSNSAGKVYLNSGTVLRDNWATTFGAAVRMSGSGWVEMNDGVTIENCRSLDHLDVANYPYNDGYWPGDGGAFMTGAGSSLYIKGGLISNCYASGRGGAISFWGGPSTLQITGGTISNCWAGELGGAIYLSESFSGDDGVILQNCTITGCHAPNGGAIAIRRRKEAQTKDTYTTKLTLKTGATVTGCYTDTGYGGALYCDETKDGFTNASSPTPNPNIYPNPFIVNMKGGKIENCYSPDMGGGIFLKAVDVASSFTMTGGEITGCYTSTYGGGAYITDSKATMTLTKGSIHGCSCGSETSSAGRGGALAIYEDAYVNINGDDMLIYGNYARYYGGAIQCYGSRLDFSKGSIGIEGTNNGNHAVMGAAGVHFVSGATFNMTGGKFCNNFTETLGGAFHANGTCNLTVEGGEFCHNIAYKQGGAINLDNGPLNTSVLTIPAGSPVIMHHNRAGRGGAIMVDGSIMTINGGEFYNNDADGTYVCTTGTPLNADEKGFGGAFCLLTYNSGAVTASILNLGGGAVHDNTATSHGGAIYMGKTVSVSGGSVLNRDPEIHISGGSIYDNHANGGNGGGVYLESGTFEMTAGSFEGNTASQNGGAVYITEVTGRTMSGQITGGNIGSSGKGNEAACGGGIYANGGTMTVDYSSEAAGMIQYNYASSKGGGLYISSTGTLNLYGNTTLQYNRVPLGGYGGGVYLEGVVQAGHGSSQSDVIKVVNNFVGAAGATITDVNRNNIYLPDPMVNTAHKDVITVVNNGLNLGTTSIGFSVPDNFVPVIYCATKAYLNPTLMGSSSIFEDSHSYQKYYTNGSDGYDPYYIYLAADTWVLHQSSTPGSGFDVSGSNVTISNAQGLAWLISYVNNFNGVTGNHTSINVILTADVDMSDHKWVPIGNEDHKFAGTFDGGGHTITGIDCSYIKGTNGTGTSIGLFGVTNGATIHDVFLNDAQLMVRDQSSGSFYLGGIVGSNNGTVYNCIASPSMETSYTGTTMGGLVGTLTGGTIHSSSAMPTKMKGYTMGGLVGTMASGTNLKNSFANPKFDYIGTGQYVGGLVAINSGGTVENCYVREQAGSSHGNYFGWVVGNNISGTVTYCYIPYNETVYKYAGDAAVATTCTTYQETSTPYLYKHADNQMTANSANSHIVNGALGRDGLKGLLATLNDWVGSNSTYSKWMRTCASPINSDYPIHEYSNYVCVASKDNIALEYSQNFNAKFDTLLRANSGAGAGTIYLYKSPSAAISSSLSNSNKATQVYIHEDVVLLHSSAIKAHVGITLDNSAGSNGPPISFGGSDNIDWHFFSSALADAPIGLLYGDSSPYNAYVYPSWQASFTASNAANGYFPVTDFDGNNYYFDWDLYAYYEPDYHWINLKRNSASHWHEDYPDTHIYPYTNDTVFVPGRGYMVALKDEGYLQGYGTLNTNSGTGTDYISVPVTYTSSIAWTTREGHNLLGNPYQSYLDFDKFAEKNATLWNTTPFYIIIDEDKADYVLYTVGQSPNKYRASRFLHPHQGFMIDVYMAGYARFSNAMRTTSTATTGENPVTWSGSFRGETSPCYPLVNLFATDSYGNRDMVTVELGRPDKGGTLKQDAWRTGTGSLSCHYEGEDYDLVFTQPDLEYANIRFACDEDGEYTMTWNTQNGDFSYLHLIDNITGSDIDCLSKSEYKFSARISDYNSRFRLMFGYTGIEEPEVPEPVEGPTCFAFIMNGELVVNGRGFLQLIDLNGRMLSSYNINDTQSMVTLPNIPAGIYVLRLITENGTRTQKIILD